MSLDEHFMSTPRESPGESPGDLLHFANYRFDTVCGNEGWRLTTTRDRVTCPTCVRILDGTDATGQDGPSEPDVYRTRPSLDPVGIGALIVTALVMAGFGAVILYYLGLI